jgi:ketosteroid isomerase-like protein
MKNTIALFCVFISLVGCNTAPKIDTAAEADLIRDLENQWTEAIKATDVDKIISFYATEAVSMSNEAPITIGPQNIKSRIEKQFADTTVLFETYSGTIDAIEVAASGDLAYARGHDDISLKTSDGIVSEAGKWIDIYKKIDGEWKVVVSIGNSNQPTEEK